MDPIRKFSRLCRKGIFWSWVLSSVSLFSATKPSAPVYVLKLSDAIQVGAEEYLHRGLQAAQTAGSPALLIEMDTPGGFLESTRAIVQEFLASKVPIIVWVTPPGARAASAGSMIAMAAHFAAMAESTSIGAATPISGDGKDIPADLKNKITNDTLSFVEGISQKRGRNIEWAKKSVTEAASLSSERALKEHVIDALANSRADVWKSFRVKFPAVPETVEFLAFPASVRESALGFLSNPNVAYALLGIGSLGIYLELASPGAVLPGVVGVLALAIGSISMRIVPVRPGAILLFVIGMILMFIEFVTPIPTHGSAGVGAVIAILLSGIFWVNPEQTNLTLNPGFWVPAFIVVAGFCAYFLYSSVRAIGRQPASQGSTLMVGKFGKIRKVRGEREISVFVDGTLWDAEWADAQSVPHADDPIEVVAQDNLKLVVKRKEITHV